MKIGNQLVLTITTLQKELCLLTFQLVNILLRFRVVDIDNKLDNLTLTISITVTLLALEVEKQAVKR